jgi:hypothetical protein
MEQDSLPNKDSWSEWFVNVMGYIIIIGSVVSIFAQSPYKEQNPCLDRVIIGEINFKAIEHKDTYTFPYGSRLKVMPDTIILQNPLTHENIADSIYDVSEMYFTVKFKIKFKPGPQKLIYCAFTP